MANYSANISVLWRRTQEALGGGLKGKKGTEMPWVYLGGLGAEGFKANQVNPRHFSPFFSFKLLLKPFPSSLCLLGSFLPGARDLWSVRQG